MIQLDVLIKAISVAVKNLSINVADEACVSNVFQGIIRLVTELGKCINDNTEDNVQQYCDHNQEESKIVHRPEVETLAIFYNSSLCWQVLTDSSTTSETVVDGAEEAVHHGHANTVSLSIKKSTVDVVIIESVSYKYESDGAVDINDDDSKHRCHDQLVSVYSY